MSHTCHAINCQVAVPPRIFMCKKHWFMLPKPMRDAIWAAYVPGQERRKDPNMAYLSAAYAAEGYIAIKEGFGDPVYFASRNEKYAKLAEEEKKNK